jgi:cytochrome c oxidase subunit II
MLVAAGGGMALLSGCSGQGARFGLLAAASDRAKYMGHLWVGAWIASLLIGGLVWGLIFYSIYRFRRRPGNEVPRQTKYNLPMELLYTLVPIFIIVVLFFFTVKAQDAVLANDHHAQHTVDVVAQKWSWTFNYMEAGNDKVGTVVHEVGTLEKIPELYLVVNQSVQFNLKSADVIHSFWVPAFYFKMDVIPGHPNSFELTPTVLGTYQGKCAELCGTYHSSMIFVVHVVTEQEYYQQLDKLKADGQVGEITPPAAATYLPSSGTSEGP